MSSLSKTGTFRKTGTSLLGVALLSSLLLTACAPDAQTNASEQNPTASVTAEVPKGITKFKSEAFDLSKQVSVNLEKEGTNLLTGSGVVSKTNDGGKITVTYTPYESKEGVWEYTTNVALTTNPKVQLMRWKDKSYFVIDGWKDAKEAANGLTAEKNTQEQYVIVLDAVTGKVVNTFKGEAFPLGDNDPDRFSFNPRVHTSNDRETAISFLTGLVYKTSGGQAKLIDPLTGETVATNSKDFGPTPLNNETGFYADKIDTAGKSTTKAMFGNFAFVSNENINGNIRNSVFTLVNTVTNETVSEMKCLGTGDDTHPPKYSANFRYVILAGQYVFDTKTGKSFCSSPTGKEDMRQFKVTAVDNDGNMYGIADKDYLKISLADTAKVDTLMTDVTDSMKNLVSLTDKGSALFYSEQSDDVVVAVPAKTLK